MALSSTQRSQVRLYVGWSSRFNQTDSQLEMALNAVDGDAEILTLVGGLLTSLLDVDAKLVDAHKRIKAKALGSITLMEEKEIGVLRSEGRRFAGRLAAILGVPVRHDAFAGSGPTTFAGYAGPYGGGGNLPRLG